MDEGESKCSQWAGLARNVAQFFSMNGERNISEVRIYMNSGQQKCLAWFDHDIGKSKIGRSEIKNLREVM